ncbi:MAG: arylsulfatase [Verrucomicrobiota bacterium]
MNIRLTILLLSILFLHTAPAANRATEEPSNRATAAQRPNIILIMVDDMGFSDLGYHGGEIDTPNIDALAHGGVRFSHFYNSGRCCPTRATLMTGLHPHEVGIGHMTQSPTKLSGEGKPPAYQGYLNRNGVTIAEALKPAGYATFLAGKWHLGTHDEDRWPLQRGFEKFYGCVPGATRFFSPIEPRHINIGNEIDTELKSTTDRPYYTTDAFTDHAMRFIEEEIEDENRPFFLYLAYTAPHWPLQAHEEDIAKYRGKYREGWDKLREQRYQKQIELGLVDPAWKLSPRDEQVPAWDSLDEKKQDEMDLKMAIYAAMIDRVDQRIGDLVAFLKEHDIYDNTLIMFLTDNGACAEGGVLGRGEFYDIDKRNQESGNAYGRAWANASSTPFRLYKHFCHEGGSATPFFLHWPSRIKPSEDWYDSPAQLIDIMPTVLELAAAEYPKKFQGNNILPLDGITLAPAFDGKPLDRANPIFVEHENNAFVRDGDWKLVGKGVSPAKGVQEDKWELYNLKDDRTELNDLSAQLPEKRAELAGLWSDWSQRAKVFPKENEKPKTNKSKNKN